MPVVLGKLQESGSSTKLSLTMRLPFPVLPVLAIPFASLTLTILKRPGLPFGLLAICLAVSYIMVREFCKQCDWAKHALSRIAEAA